MNILGFMGFAGHDPAACVLKTEKDGTFKYSTISEERLNRVKYSYHFPLRSIHYCMETLNIQSLDDIDLVINDWSQHRNGFESNYSYRKLEYDYLRRNLNIDKTKIKLIPSLEMAVGYLDAGYDSFHLIEILKE